MNAADSRRAGVIERRRPAEASGGIAPVCDVRRKRIEPGAGTFTDQVHDDFGARYLTDVIPSSNPPVLDDHRVLPDATSFARELLPKWRHEGTQMFIHRVRIQTVRHDQEHVASFQASRPRERARIGVAQPFSRNRTRQVLVSTGGLCSYTHMTRKR